MRSRLCMGGRCLRAAAGRSYFILFLLTERFDMCEGKEQACVRGASASGS